jgi:dihydrofolate reductase
VRRIRYAVATSLDGYIAGPKGEADWIIMDPEFGGVLFRSLLKAGLVDTVEVAVFPVLLGGGIPMLPPPAGRARLELTGHRVYKTGVVSLEYAVK